MAANATTVKYLIVGGGLTGATAARTIRQHDPDGGILMICGEPHLPYHRPPLSKEYLRGEADFDAARIAMEDDYRAANIALRLGMKAVAADTSTKTVTLNDGSTIAYEKLLIATGAGVKKLDPGETPGADAPNILYLRTIDDSDALKAAFARSRRVVVMGAGYIGMETAADAAQAGLDVTIVDTAKQPWGKNTSPDFGAFLEAYYKQKGVTFFLNNGVTEFVLGADGVATGVHLKSGETIPCDLVIAGVGSKLNLDLPTAAGLEVDPKEGVSTDEFLETAVPGVFVAGDIARFHDPVLGKDWHVEHWQNAEWQGQIAGANMAGVPTPYDHVPYFFSDEFDLHMLLRGDPQAGKSHFAIGSMAPDTDGFLELYLREDGTLAQGLLISKAKDESATSELLEKMIRAHALVAPHQVALQAGTKRLEDLG